MVSSRWARWLGCWSAGVIALGVVVLPSRVRWHSEGAHLSAVPPPKSREAVVPVVDTVPDSAALANLGDQAQFGFIGAAGGNSRSVAGPRNPEAPRYSVEALLVASSLERPPRGIGDELGSAAAPQFTRSLTAPRIAADQGTIDGIELDANSIVQFAEGNSSVVFQDRLMRAAGVAMNIRLDHGPWPYGPVPGPQVTRGRYRYALPHPEGSRVQVVLKWAP
jgi:hypothetical protein